MHSIAQVIATHEEKIRELWADGVRRTEAAHGLSDEELLDVVPLYLGSLAHPEIGARGSERHDLLEEHLASRLRQGFEIADIVEEFGLLGRCITRIWAECPEGERPAPADLDRTLAELQTTTCVLVHMYREHVGRDDQREKRYLRRLQRVVLRDLAGEEAPASTWAPDVLELVLRAMAADVALLSLRAEPDPDGLALVASAGLDLPLIEELGGPVQRSRVPGEIGWSRRPCANDAGGERGGDAEDALDRALAARGIRTLLAVRTPPRGPLLGMLEVGLRDGRDFSSRERRFLEALAEQLAVYVECARRRDGLRQEVLVLADELRAANTFVAQVAHDLRGPLAVARAGAELLVRRSRDIERPAEDELRGRVSRIVRNLDRIARLTDELLDACRIRAGEPLPLATSECDLTVLAAEIAEDVGQIFGGRVLVDADPRVRGFWSESQLRRVVWNLLTNGLKYGARNTPVLLRVERRADGPRITVHNEGAPIPAAELPRLFEPFTRAQGAAQRAPGWGIGLSVVRACVEAHGGALRVESEEGTGTSFVVDLPWRSRP